MKSYIFTIIFALSCTFLSGCNDTARSTTQPASAVQEQQAAKSLPSISPASQAWYEKGFAAYQRFSYDEAIANYDKALEADKNNYNALSGKGIALAMRGNESGAKSDVEAGILFIQKALAIVPDDVASFYNLALSYKINGQYDEAIHWFQQVIAKDPDNTWSYYGIATIYGDKGDAKNAVLYLRKAAALDKENVLHAAQSQTHFDSIRNDAAFKELINS